MTPGVVGSVGLSTHPVQPVVGMGRDENADGTESGFLAHP